VKMLNEVNEGVLTAGEAARLLGVTLRQVRRLIAAYRMEGVAALAHGNRGRHPARTIAVELPQPVSRYGLGPRPGMPNSSRAPRIIVL